MATDSTYDDIFKQQIIPIMREFCPDIIIVSAGFDAGINDPLGQYRVTAHGFANLVKQMRDVSDRIALVLEGGYNLETISKSMLECTKILLE